MQQGEMQHVQVQTAQNVGIDIEVAGIGDRVLAVLIDYLVLFAYVLVVSLLISIGFDAAGIDPPATVIVLLYLPLIFYFLLCEVFFNGQSIGKRLRQIKVARLDGTQPTLGNYLLRWLMRPIEIGMFGGVPALASIVLSDAGQRLGDRAAGTTVISLKPRATLQDTLFTPVNPDYVPTFPQVTALTADDATTAREVLLALVTERRSARVQHLGTMMQRTLETKMGLRSDLDPVAFLRAVVKDYNEIQGRLT